jgi:hypothetical protein
MRYVKTFENFNYDSTNEGWLWGEGNIFSKISSWYSKWKNKKAVEAAEATKKAVEANLNNPKIQAVIEKLKSFKPEELDKELSPALEAYNPDTASPAAPKGTEEEIQQLVQDSVNISKTKYGTKLYESRVQAINENAESLGQKILSWFKLNGKYLALIVSAILAITAIATLATVVAGAFATGLVAVGIYGAIVCTLLSCLTGYVMTNIYKSYRAEDAKA